MGDNSYENVLEEYYFTGSIKNCNQSQYRDCIITMFPDGEIVVNNKLGITMDNRIPIELSISLFSNMIIKQFGTGIEFFDGGIQSQIEKVVKRVLRDNKLLE